jgi:hypothetical protein
LTRRRAKHCWKTAPKSSPKQRHHCGAVFVLAFLWYYFVKRRDFMELKPGKYRHFKGNEYQLLYVARHSETLEEMVVYQALYGERGIWVRPAHMWNETVCRDGKEYTRFVYIGDEGEKE